MKVKDTSKIKERPPLGIKSKQNNKVKSEINDLKYLLTFYELLIKKASNLVKAKDLPNTNETSTTDLLIASVEKEIAHKLGISFENK